MTPPAVLVTTRYRPHELLLLLTSIIVGVNYLAGVGQSAALAAVRPQWMVAVWAVSMVLSGACGLAGCLAWRRDQVRALRVEGFAMDLGAAAVAFYTVAILAVTGLGALTAAVIFVGWVGANLWRGRIIAQQLRQLRGPR